MTVQQPDVEAPLVWGTPLTRDSWERITERDFEHLDDDQAEAWIEAVVAAAGVPTEFTSKNRTDLFHRSTFGSWVETMIEDPIARAWHDDDKDQVARLNAEDALSHCRKIYKKVKKRRRAEQAELQRQAEEQRRAEAQAAQEHRLRAEQHLRDLEERAAEAIRIADDMPPLDRQNLPATPREQWTPW